MDDQLDQASRTPKAPTYNELIALVEALRKQVTETTVTSDANAKIIDTSVSDDRSLSETSSRRPALDFRVLPDLDKTVGVFSGRETTHVAADWLTSVEGVANLNCWPFAYRLQFVRANVQGAAKDWFVGRTFGDWQDFKTQFHATFIRAVRMSDRWEALRRRYQAKDEHLMDYFQSKVRLCRDLSLPYDEVRDHVIQGLYSRDLAMYALGRVHRDENDLLVDILDWERMDSLRRSSAKAERPTKVKDTIKYNTGPQNQSSSDTQGDKKTWRRAVPIEQKTNFETSVLIKQGADKHRLCVDYRRLNKQTLRQHFPLPDMNEQLHSLGNSKLFTQLDLASGYLQIPLTDEAAAKTAFITEDTTGQFTRMPFGLCGAVAEFTRLMRHVLGPLHGKVVRNYLDDMVIDAVDWDDMLSKLRLVFDRLRSACLTLKPSKCVFGAKQIEFLGFIIGGGLIQPGELKTRAILDFPTPVDVVSLKRFLGLTGFFRRFVEGYATIAKPLIQLTKKNADFLWRDEQDHAFRVLKDRLTEPPVLAMFNPISEVTELHTDASSVRLGAMLLQSVKVGDPLKLIYCVSKKTSDCESKYHSSKLELMCIVWAMNKLRQFLLGLRFVVYTDCQALVYLNSFKATNAQVARWHDILQEFNFSVKYRPGIRMGHVDALSRAPIKSVTENEIPVDLELQDRWDVCVLLTVEDKVRMCQTADEELSELTRAVEYNLNNPGPKDKNFVVEVSLLLLRVMSKLLVIRF